jgi:hypothetical protein
MLSTKALAIYNILAMKGVKRGYLAEEVSKDGLYGHDV